jgi:hypothetical protein
LSREVTNLLYLITIVTFILALRFLSNPATARRGNQIGAAGMLVAIVVTFLQKGVNSYWEIIVGMIVGGAFGAVAARRVRMTAMPQMVALFNGVGGGAAALISLAEFHLHAPDPGALKADISSSIVLSAIIGSISFSGSMIAFAKLQELIRGRPITYPLQQCDRGGRRAAVADVGDTRRLVRLRNPLRPSDRRCRHAGRDLVAERVHRSRRGGNRFRARKQRPDRQRHARRCVGNAAHDHDGTRDEPVCGERALRRLRPDCSLRPRRRCRR